MAEDGIQDFIGILNVTMKGVENAGKTAKYMADAGFKVARGSYKILAKLIKMLTWIVRTISERQYYKTGGEVKNKVLQTKFQDLNFDTVNLYSPKDLYTKLNSEHPGNYDQAKIDSLLNPEALRKEFENLAKKTGLLYAKIPNFITDKNTGVIEYRFAYSKSQEAAMLETKTQLNALIYERLKKCGVKDDVAKEISDSIVDPVAPGKPLMQNLDEIGLGEVTDEQFEVAMKEAFPKYDPAEFTPVEPTAEKKTICSEVTESNEYASELAKGNVKELYFSAIKDIDNDNLTMSVQPLEYPNVVMTFKTSSVLDSEIIQPTSTDHDYIFRAALKKDGVYNFEVYHADPKTGIVDMTQNPKHYEMTFKEFERMMAQNAEKVKHQEAQLKAVLTDRSEQFLPAAPKSRTPKKNQ